MALGLLGQTSDVLGCAFYLASATSTSLTVVSVAGAIPSNFLRTTADIGEKIIGWSLATHSQVRNAAIELEFGSSPPFPAAKCSAFPAKTATGLGAVMAVFSAGEGLTEQEAITLGSIAVDMAASANADVSPVEELPLKSIALLSSFLPTDRTSAAACFPIGVLAVKLPEGLRLSESESRSLVRSTDSVVALDNGTLVFLLQRASEASVNRVTDRLKNACELQGRAPMFEWTILSELSERVDGQVSDVINTLGHGIHGPMSTKLH
jgi:hypothetical protein